MTDAPDKAKSATVPERIAKVMARSGLCSRRDAERMIAEGRVALAGKTVETPATLVRPGDPITVDGQALPEREKVRLWRYHKPDGLVTTHRDEKGRQTVFDRMPEGMPRVISVGRLDLTSEGLLLLTNDGGLARALELPSTGWKRRYRVRVYGRVTEDDLAKLAAGITVEGVNYGPIDTIYEREQGDNAWLSMSLREGKNREIRRVLEHLGLQVNRLIRVAYGPFQLGNLPRGEVEEVRRGVMRAQLGHLLPDGGADRGAVAKPKPKLRPGAKAGTYAKAGPKSGPHSKPGPKSGGGKPAGRRSEPGGAPKGAKTGSRKEPARRADRRRQP